MTITLVDCSLWVYLHVEVQSGCHEKILSTELHFSILGSFAYQAVMVLVKCFGCKECKSHWNLKKKKFSARHNAL